MLEVPRVPAPERLVRRLRDSGSRLRCLCHYRVDLLFAAHVVTQTQFGCAGGSSGKPGVPGQVRPRPERELETGLQLEKGDSAVLELGADDALGRKAETVPVEPQCPIEIIHTEGDQGDIWLHIRLASEPPPGFRWRFSFQARYDRTVSDTCSTNELRSFSTSVNRKSGALCPAHSGTKSQRPADSAAVATLRTSARCSGYGRISAPLWFNCSSSRLWIPRASLPLKPRVREVCPACSPSNASRCSALAPDSLQARNTVPIWTPSAPRASAAT